MPILRCFEQNRQTLEEFYQEWSTSIEPSSISIGKAMLQILEKINHTFLGLDIYGSTSHAHLILHSTNTNDSDWYVSIIAMLDEFHIEYKLPRHKAPWPDATTKGATKSLEEFMKYLVIAMKESEGWKDNEEFNVIYNKLTLNL